MAGKTIRVIKEIKESITSKLVLEYRCCGSIKDEKSIKLSPGRKGIVITIEWK